MNKHGDPQIERRAGFRPAEVAWGVGSATIACFSLVYVASLLGATKLGFLLSAVMFAVVAFAGVIDLRRRPESPRTIIRLIVLTELCVVALLVCLGAMVVATS